ncbi:MAG: heavy-metal-associated domain-containing protein [Bacteroidota bacterium]
MKYLSLIFCLFLLACGGAQTEGRFFVEGACEECKALIEASLQGVEGIAASKWDQETSILSVIYDIERISEDGIQQAVSEAGFNTQFFDGEPSARASLPDCCRHRIEQRLKRDSLMSPY